MPLTLQYIQQELLKNAQEAYRQAYEALNGNIDTGTIDQILALMDAASSMVRYLNDVEKPEEGKHYDDIWIQCFNSLRESVDHIENSEEKEFLLETLSDCGSWFALRGINDKAIAAAKLSPRVGQYAPAERLTRIADVVARECSFDQAIPFLDEAIKAAIAADNWIEFTIMEVAQFYWMVGRRKKAEDVIAPLPAQERFWGLLRFNDIDRCNKKGEEQYQKILKRCEALIAETFDGASTICSGGDNHSDHFCHLACHYLQCDMPQEAERIIAANKLDSYQHGSGYAQYGIDSVHGECVNYWVRMGNPLQAEKHVDQIQDETYKTACMMELIRHKECTTDRAVFQRLLDKAESFIRGQKTRSDISYLLRIAALKIKFCNELEGRKMMDELLTNYEVDSPPAARQDWLIGLAATALQQVGLLDDAAARIETIDSPDKKANAYWLLMDTYLWEQEDSKMHEQSRRHRRGVFKLLLEETDNDEPEA